MAGIRFCVIGLGNRARKYLKYLEGNPLEGELVAVVDRDPRRLFEAQNFFGVPKKGCFFDVDEFLCSDVKADAAIVATIDDSHYEIATKILSAGLHLLLEKPMALTLKECEDLAEQAARTPVVSGMCYVMRYHPYFMRIRELVSEGTLGKIHRIEHCEVVGINRMTHSYVRGTWAKAEDSCPIFYAKCCHDVDFLLWIAGLSAPQTQCRVISVGSLTKYCPESAPEEATLRCIDCPVETSCRYSAVDLYRRRRDWVGNFIVEEGSDLTHAIEHELKEGKFGRCAFFCDNNVSDYQRTKLIFEDGLTMDIEMDGITDGDGRRTVVHCENGSIVAADGRIEVNCGGNVWTEDFTEICARPLHAGADLAIMEDFCRAIVTGTQMQAPLVEALCSSRICIMAN